VNMVCGKLVTRESSRKFVTFVTYSAPDCAKVRVQGGITLARGAVPMSAIGAHPLRTLIRYCQLGHAKKSDPLGATWCERKFVGRVRRELAARRARDTLSFGALPADSAINDFAEALREQCRACGECEMGRE
jgi:hypothetical protein